jgi:hypothetical protein
VVPRGLSLRLHSRVEQWKAERSNERKNLVPPSHRHVVKSFDQRPLWHAPAGLDWAVALARPRGHTDICVRCRSAAAIASQSPWQRDQNGCNQREKFSSQCHNRLARKSQPHAARACKGRKGRKGRIWRKSTSPPKQGSQNEEPNPEAPALATALAKWPFSARSVLCAGHSLLPLVHAGFSSPTQVGRRQTGHWRSKISHPQGPLATAAALSSRLQALSPALAPGHHSSSCCDGRAVGRLDFGQLGNWHARRVCRWSFVL